MRLIEVNSPASKKAFHKVPFKIYKNDPHWIPHLKQDIEGVFTPGKNKFFRHGEATRWILKDDNGKVIGRVAAFINKKTANTFSQPTGGMGFFECINDQKAAFMLLDQCKAWLEERGMEAMEGPVNFGEKDKFWGLMIENFNAPGYYQQNYNPEYYVDFFKAYGFQLFFEQLIFYREMEGGLPEKFRKLSERLLSNPSYEVKTVDKNNLLPFAEDFRVIYNRAWAKSHANFAEMSSGKAKLAMKAMKPIMDERLAYFAYFEGRPIAFFIALPNVNEIFKKVNGNLNWWGKLKFVYYRWRGISKTCIGMAFGIDPDFQGKGVESIIFKKMDDLLYNPQVYDYLFIAWIGDFNPKMISIVEGLETKVFRKLATMHKLFDETKEFKRRKINRG